MAGGNPLTAAIFYSARLARPLAKPCIVVADRIPEPQPDPVDFTDLGTAPRRHIETDQESVRPAVVFGEICEGQLFRNETHYDALIRPDSAFNITAHDNCGKLGLL